MAAKKRTKFVRTRPPEPHPVDAEWRLFLAIRLPEHVRALIERLNSTLSAEDLSLRLVDPELAHLTLHFLGQTAPERAELLSLSLPHAVAQLPPLELSTGRLGVFPDDRRPRVIWLGLGGDLPALSRLHRALGVVLRAHGFEVESREAHPHITLARVRDDVPPSFPEALRAVMAGPSMTEALGSDLLSFTVTEIELIRSHLEKRGPRYETITVARLRGPR